MQPNQSSLRDLLAGYDREVEGFLREARAASTGLGRVRALHNTLRRSISVHDAVLGSGLCPLLADLPGGQAVADRLRKGCQERADLLSRFEAVSHNVAAHNVYPVSGEEIERILEGLERSFRAHVQDETFEVGNVLEAAAASVAPEVVAARMAIEAEQAPTRVHAATVKHPKSVLFQEFYREWDRFRDWSDTHWGWSDPQGVRKSPRAEQVELLKRQAAASPPSVRNLLAGYDETVEAIIAKLSSARDGVEWADAAHRLNAAVTVHDSVLGGVVCPLLETVPGGGPLAARLHEGCRQRAELERSWVGLIKEFPPEGPDREQSFAAGRITESLIESFRLHEREETLEVTGLLEDLPGAAYRTKASPFADVMWPWHSEGPSVLALHMALWAESAPTCAHPMMVRHPTSRALRSLFHVVDHFRDYWGDTTLGRWMFPELPAQPFSEAGAGPHRRHSASRTRREEGDLPPPVVTGPEDESEASRK